ncbi:MULTISPECIES: DUF2730 family protein [Idiomarina]|jgi:hypothetical protein|uniref:DUF2730 family protein n=1 Tax=Idiomarina TaxID=135575 RepID=UPI00129ACE1D|nr:MULTISPECIES: DUF2730 family protein [Idiomarina]MRJ41180.1 DUF2730 family protein [Idiomarina sp. FeN1]NCU56345.1 DUF2730 family protein [Idiomarina sp. FenA--70]NCU59364.1 DUF2730 family protein [Idiomarina sp. FenBw--71]UUN12539.1 DUF2730 family protein [Idiomarina loihiensis]
MDWVKDYAPYIIVIMQGVMLLVSLWLSKNFASRQRVESNEDNTSNQFASMNLRLQRVEDAVANQPTHHDVRQLERKLSDVSSDIKRVEPWIKQLSNHVDMLIEKELRNK